jgi:hypothetical protein
MSERYDSSRRADILLLDAQGRQMKVILMSEESEEILKQPPETAKDGGFQGLLVKLQRQLNRLTGELELTPDDLRRIPKYAFDYRNGGWETRLRRAFGRVLGPKLGRA